MSREPSIDLSRLAEVDLHTNVTLEQIEHRARELRRARLARRSVIGGLSVVAVVVAAAVLPIGGDSGDSPPVGQGVDPTVEPVDPAMTKVLGDVLVLPVEAARDNCPFIGFGSGWVNREDWVDLPAIAEAVALIGEPIYELTAVGVHPPTYLCPHEQPAAVMIDAETPRGISLWPEMEFEQSAVAHLALPSRDVRGVVGTLRSIDDSTHEVAWVEPDGIRWFAMGSGVTDGELIAILDGLTLEGEELASASVPTGFELRPVTDDAGVSELSWWVGYGLHTSPAPADAEETLDNLVLEVIPGGVTPSGFMETGAPGVEHTEVNGVEAAYFESYPENPDCGTLYWRVGDLLYTLRGCSGLDEAVRMAESVEHVGLDDPRITSAGELPGAWTLN